MWNHDQFVDHWWLIDDESVQLVAEGAKTLIDVDWGLEQ